MESITSYVKRSLPVGAMVENFADCLDVVSFHCAAESFDVPTELDIELLGHVDQRNIVRVGDEWNTANAQNQVV
jgi:hypothetical protein